MCSEDVKSEHKDFTASCLCGRGKIPVFGASNFFVPLLVKRFIHYAGPPSSGTAFKASAYYDAAPAGAVSTVTCAAADAPFAHHSPGPTAKLFFRLFTNSKGVQ